MLFFLLSETDSVILSAFIMSPANALNLDGSKKLLRGEHLILYHKALSFINPAKLPSERIVENREYPCNHHFLFSHLCFLTVKDKFQHCEPPLSYTN